MGIAGDLDDVVGLAVREGVELVGDDERGAQAFLGEGFRREDAVDRAGGIVLDGVARDPADARQLGVEGDHAPGGVEDEAGLSPVSGDGVDLGAVGLAEQAVEGAGGEEARLAVLAPDPHDRAAMPTGAISIPRVDALDEVALPET